VNLGRIDNSPTIFDRLVEAAGVAAAVALCKKRGGREVTIPHKAHGSILADIVGVDAAEKIKDEFGVCRLVVPFGPYGGAQGRRTIAIEALRDGASVSQAALQSGVHMRSVKRFKADLDGASQHHPDLFD